MLEADYLAGCGDKIVEYYAELEAEILADVARRIEKTMTITDTAKHQLEVLSESGRLYSDVYAKINSINGISQEKLKELFKQAGIKSSKFDDKIFKQAGLNPINIAQSASALQILTAGMEKTQKALTNMTMTMGYTLQADFVDICDRAYAKLSSGAFTYQQAINDAVRELGSKGVSVIDYASGKRISLEAGVRRNVLTGVNQTTATLSMNRAQELGSDLVETTAHVGARPDHQVWQGKVFSLSGQDKRYPDFKSATGYGTVSGLCGANCRHNFFPYFEGISKNAYSSEELSRMNKTVSYQGKTYTMYEAEQRLRSIERSIREWKRRAYVLQEVGGDASLELKKIKEWQRKAREFCNETGIPRDYMREKIYKGEKFKPLPNIGGKYTPLKPKMPKNAKKIEQFKESIYRSFGKDIDKKEIKEFFVKPHTDYIRALSKEQQKAIEKYTGSSYWEINRCLRGLKDDDYYKSTIDKIIEVMENAPNLKDDFVSYRRVSEEGLHFMFGDDFEKLMKNRAHMDTDKFEAELADLKKKLYNATYVEKGFCSTAYKEGAFGASKPVQIKICKPKDKGKALFLDDISVFGDSEAELLYNAGTKFAIKDIRTIKGSYDMEVEVVVQVV